MRVVTRHLAKEILISTGFVLISLVALIAFFDLVGQAKNIGNRYDFSIALFLTVLKLPSLLSQFLPVSALSCIYTGISGIKLFRLGAMILLYAFWSGAMSIFFYTVCRKSVGAFAATLFTQLMFILGTLVLAEIFRNGSLMMNGSGRIAPEVVGLCLLCLLLNPLSAYMGFYGSVTGDISIFGTFCSHLGIDTSNKWFILLFYKVSSLICILVGILFLVLSIWYMDKKRKT